MVAAIAVAAGIAISSLPALGVMEDPNVAWVQLTDSVATCPAGDSLFGVNGHPCRVRGMIFYGDNNHSAKAHVPPDSMWIKTSTASGNLIVNDESDKIFADDSTNASGYARFTIPSISGCGKLRLALFVSNVAYDTLVITVRSVDGDASGRVDLSEAGSSPPCDVNYSGGAPNSSDGLVALTHIPHSHRNALFGTPVRLTNLLESGDGDDPGHIGDGDISWEPGGDRIAFSAHISTGDCAIHWVKTNPAGSDGPHQFSHPASGVHDYDPSWSPRRNLIVWDRGDTAIFGRYVPGVPGAGADTTTEFKISSSATGDVQPAISPNGRTIAFVRVYGSSPTIWSEPVTGGSATRLTVESGVSDSYPQWSPDGQWITFQRTTFAADTIGLFKIPAAGGAPATPIYFSAAVDTYEVTPAYSADGQVITFGGGNNVRRIRTIEPAQSTLRPSDQYLAFAAPQTAFPQLSPDGTRLAFIQWQVFAARRNMNQPPVLDSIRDRTITEGDSINIVVHATDPESDALTYNAYFLVDSLNMHWSSGSHTFAWRTPSGTANHSYWLKFQASTPSGGTDYEVVQFNVVPHGMQQQAAQSPPVLAEGYANPSRKSFAFTTPLVPGARAKLYVYSAQGRLLAVKEGSSGAPLTWEGVDTQGRSLPSGIYLYRWAVANQSGGGKWVLLR